MRLPAASVAETDSRTQFPMKLTAPEGCPKFTSRVVRGIDNRARRRRGCASGCAARACAPSVPVVDVTNYVMLELGQPMHAYDLAKLKGGLEARLAPDGEPITLLDGKEIKLTADVS